MQHIYYTVMQRGKTRCVMICKFDPRFQPIISRLMVTHPVRHPMQIRHPLPVSQFPARLYLFPHLQIPVRANAQCTSAPGAIIVFLRNAHPHGFLFHNNLWPARKLVHVCAIMATTFLGRRFFILFSLISFGVVYGCSHHHIAGGVVKKYVLSPVYRYRRSRSRVTKSRFHLSPVARLPQETSGCYCERGSPKGQCCDFMARVPDVGSNDRAPCSCRVCRPSLRCVKEKTTTYCVRKRTTSAPKLAGDVYRPGASQCFNKAINAVVLVPYTPGARSLKLGTHNRHNKHKKRKSSRRRWRRKWRKWKKKSRRKVRKWKRKAKKKARRAKKKIWKKEEKPEEHLHSM